MIRLKLKPILENHNITPYGLAKQMQRPPSVIYGFLEQAEDTRIKAETLGEIIKALRAMTQLDIQVSDLLEYHE